MSFSQSSSQIQLQDVTLTAECKRISGEYNSSSLNLDDHVGNHDGVLTFGSKRFSDTSDYISLSGSVLQASCRDCMGGYVCSELNLDDYISNIDGVLTPINLKK